MGCYRVSEPDFATDEPVWVVTADALRAKIALLEVQIAGLKEAARIAGVGRDSGMYEHFAINERNHTIKILKELLDD
jgi:hypothetical protein